MSIMKDHTQSVKILCNLLGEAQTAILDIASKLKASNQTELCKTACINKSEKSIQLKLSNNEQTSNHELELKSFSEEDEYYCSPDISTQVEREDCISDKEILSDVTISASQVDDVIDKVKEIGAILREQESDECNSISNSSLYDGYLIQETGFPDYFVERDLNNLSVISERTEKSTSEADSVYSTDNNNLVKPTTSAGFSYLSNSSSKRTEIESAQSSTSEKESVHSIINRGQLESKPWKTFTSNSNRAKEAQSLKSFTLEEENVFINKEQAKKLNVICEEFNCPMNINKHFIKNVKSLKCRAAEVVISSIISQKNNIDIDEMKSLKSCGESIEEKRTKDIQDASKNLEVSVKNKLAIQMMPSIDIPRGLVTQMIPTIVITPSESIPPKAVLQDSNVAYEIVRHISSDKINYPVVVRESSPGEATTSCIAEKCKVRYVLQSKKSNTSSMEHEIPCNTEARETESYHWKNLGNDCGQLSANTLESEQSSSPTCANSVFGNAIAKKRADDGRPFIQTSLRLDVPVTTFMNNGFKAESESEIFIMNKDLEAEIPSEESNTTKISTIAELVDKNCVKEFVNQMMKNPKTEAVFKSYQVIEEQLCHDPEEIEIDSRLSYMDTDVYKTYVNPEGFKGHPRNSHNMVEKYLSLGVTTPLEFYATKSVQCGETTFENRAEDSNVEGKVIKCKTIEENMSEDKVVEDKMIREIKIVNPDEDCGSDTTNIWSIDSASQSISLFKDGDGLKFYKAEPTPLPTEIREIVQDPSYVSRATKMLHQSNSHYTPIVNSRSGIPRDVQKQLTKSSSVNRGSNQRSSLNRRSHQTGRVLELLSSKSKQGSEHSHILKSSHSVPSPFSSKESQFGGSVKSETTADVIFQINRESLRSKSIQSKIDLEQFSDGNVRRLSASGSNMESMGGRGTELQLDGSVVTASEYVITHDISLQTSVSDLSEAVINLHQYSKDSIATGVEKLKDIVVEDTQSEGDLNTFVCCPGLRCNKNKTSNDVYMKSIKQVQPMHTTGYAALLSQTDNERQKSVKMNLPVASAVNKPQTPGVILPDDAHEPGGSTPVGSFIEGLTSHNKNQIFLARKTPPKNELSVLEDLDAAEIVSVIKRATESWKEFDKQRDSGAAEVSSQKSAQNILLTDDDFAHRESNIDNKTNGATKNSDGEEDNSDDVSMSKIEAYTIMTVNVEHPERFGHQQFQMLAKESEKPLPNTFPLHRNVPGGDDFSEPLELGNSGQFYVTHARHEGIYPRHTSLRQKQIKKMYESSSSSEATACESSLEKTDGNLSEGEVKCKCSASIGEVHVCPFGKNRKSNQYLKRNAKNFLKHEFGSRDVKIRWRKEYNSNWVAYYVSRDASPELDNSESVDKSSTDSSGLIRK